jgi:hypothetical protein
MVQRGVVKKEIIEKHLNEDRSNPSSNVTFNYEKQILKEEIMQARNQNHSMAEDNEDATSLF